MPVNPKPGTAPARWAITAGGTPAANISTPPSGQQDTGWTNGQVPPSAWQNWFQWLTYVWLLFFSYLFTDGGQAAGNMDLGATAESNLVPLTKYRDYSQNIRASIDHNGFRMGQVSEIDENWRCPPVVVHLSLPAITPNGGGVFVASTYAIRLSTTSDGAFLGLSHIPVGAIITSLVLSYTSGNTSNTVTGTLQYTPDDGSAGASQVYKQITTATSGSWDIFSGTVNGEVVVTNNQAWTLFVQANSIVGGHIDILDVQVTYTLPPAGWSWTGDTAGLIASGNGDRLSTQDAFGASGINQRAMTLTTKASGSVAGNSLLLSSFDTGFDADTLLEMEFMVGTGAIDDGSHAANFDLGFKWSGGQLVRMHWDHSTANWQLQLIGTLVDSGVAAAANTNYRVRLELYGKNRNSSGHVRCKLYLNGTLVATVTDSSDTIVASGAVAAIFEAGTVGTAGGPYNYSIGRVRRVWNHIAAGDNL